jgi:hypothetical protein
MPSVKKHPRLDRWAIVLVQCDSTRMSHESHSILGPELAMFRKQQCVVCPVFPMYNIIKEGMIVIFLISQSYS